MVRVLHKGELLEVVIIIFSIRQLMLLLGLSIAVLSFSLGADVLSIWEAVSGFVERQMVQQKVTLCLVLNCSTFKKTCTVVVQSVEP